MTVVDASLHTCLRTLKLSGMLDTLDARLAQARNGELGHLDFLQVLCHDEIARRDTTSMQRRIRRAHFEQLSTLEEFDFAVAVHDELPEGPGRCSRWRSRSRCRCRRAPQ